MVSLNAHWHGDNDIPILVWWFSNHEFTIKKNDSHDFQTSLSLLGPYRSITFIGNFGFPGCPFSVGIDMLLMSLPEDLFLYGTWTGGLISPLLCNADRPHLGMEARPIHRTKSLVLHSYSDSPKSLAGVPPGLLDGRHSKYYPSPR
jgi:hypothetical protein